MRKRFLILILMVAVLPVMAEEPTDSTVTATEPQTPQSSELVSESHTIHFRGEIIFGGQINLTYSDIVFRSTDEVVVEWMKTISVYQLVRDFGMIKMASAEANVQPVPPKKGEAQNE